MLQSMNCLIPRKRWFLGLLSVSVLFTVYLAYIRYTSARSLREVGLVRKIAELQTRLKFIKTQYDINQEKLYEIQNSERTEPTRGNTVKKKFTYSPALQALLKNMTGSRAADAALFSESHDIIKAPFSLRIMPHLLQNPDSLRPAYLLRSDRKFVEYIIGVPHVKRDRETYLYKTIHSLLRKLSENEKSSTIIVVMIGETNLDYVLSTAYNIEKEFPHEVKAGDIEVISPDKSYYPDMDTLPLTLGDSGKRVKWRTKQNLDAIFLMAYAESRCSYYLMLEDDVIASNSYMKQIQEYTTATNKLNPNWIFIQYCTTGGIGKLFRSTDLLYFINFVQLFYYNKPIDWLTESYLADRVCGFDDSSKECAKKKNSIRPTYKKNLFEHIGTYSSLKGKYQKVKGYTTSPTAAYFPHSNPPVSKIFSEVEASLNFTIEGAYNGSTFFWGKNPKNDDVIEFWFKNPTTINRYAIRSGSYEHEKDKIQDAVFEILPEKDNSAFVVLATFDEFGMVEGNNAVNYTNLLSVRIRFTKDSKYWVLINEIDFQPLSQEKS